MINSFKPNSVAFRDFNNFVFLHSLWQKYFEFENVIIHIIKYNIHKSAICSIKPTNDNNILENTVVYNT